ncbi:MAG: ABC transporter permease [Hymenobacter sp.]|nr:ABC transporter permease [Hymenobacter sp.]
MSGNLGRSYRTEESVAALVGAALLTTVPLTCLAALLIVGVSVPLGLWLASRSATHWLLTGLLALDALPLFVVALLLLLLLANPDFFALFPAYGLGMEDESGGQIGTLFRYPQFIVLPLTSLVLTGLTEPVLQLTSALRHEARLDYILTARAKGLSQKRALRRHALRNALLPTLTLFTELLPNLLAGAVVVELIFALPGLGRLIADAAAARDYPLLLGGILMVLAARQFTLALADWLYQLADPRLRSTSSR